MSIVMDNPLVSLWRDWRSSNQGIYQWYDLEQEHKENKAADLISKDGRDDYKIRRKDDVGMQENGSDIDRIQNF